MLHIFTSSSCGTTPDTIYDVIELESADMGLAKRLSLKFVIVNSGVTITSPSKTPACTFNIAKNGAPSSSTTLGQGKSIGDPVPS